MKFVITDFAGGDIQSNVYDHANKQIELAFEDGQIKGTPEPQSWAVVYAESTVNHDYDSVVESNWEYLDDHLEDNCPEDTLIVRASSQYRVYCVRVYKNGVETRGYGVAEDIIESLRGYPSLDSGRQSDMEREMEEEQFNGWVITQYLSEPKDTAAVEALHDVLFGDLGLAYDVFSGQGDELEEYLNNSDDWELDGKRYVYIGE